MRRGVAMALVALVMATATSMTGGIRTAAASGGSVTVLYPLNGTLTSSPLESPPHHHFWGNFAIDDASGAGTAVHANFANASGSMSLSLGGTFEPCAAAGSAGSGVIVKV